MKESVSDDRKDDGRLLRNPCAFTYVNELKFRTARSEKEENDDDDVCRDI